MDFTIDQYKGMLQAFQSKYYEFLTLHEYIKNPFENCIILRHDVDRLPNNALHMAYLESKLDIRSTYYFRTVPSSYDEEVIKDIASLGHEIGYHYENLSHCRGDFEEALSNFEKNLNLFRKIYPVKTICMHGSPLSKWDNRDLWNRYDYRDFGVLAEPYFDIDFNKVFYITDTGRRWNGENTSIRDKVLSGKSNRELSYRSTKDIIQALRNNSFPKQVMMTTHPQRWTNDPWLWTQELIIQNLKNIAKYLLVKLKAGRGKM